MKTSVLLPQRLAYAVSLCLVFVLVALPERAAAEEPRTILYIVRHAEKDVSREDEPLTPAGWERARLYADVLRDAGIAAIYVTNTSRTRQTMAPLSERLGLLMEIIPVEPGKTTGHVKRLIAHVLKYKKGKSVVISSHSNVIPLLLRELGITEPVSIADAEYDNLFIVTLPPEADKSGTASMLRLRIGTPYTAK